MKFTTVLLFSLVASCLAPVAAAQPDASVTEVRIDAISGFRYDPPRFVVAPGAKVKLVLRNADQMMHNLAIVQPGSRLEVVKIAAMLGSDAPKLNYLPKSDLILHGVPVLAPGQTRTLQFTAPSKPGVYPYVCTYPGHGFAMYGAMYVGRNVELLPIEEDPNLPPPLPEAPEHAMGLLMPGHGAKVVREFMPDCGPAAIAVGLPLGQSVCWDAGECRLRYAWAGGFITIEFKKHDQAKLVGEVWYRAADGAFPLRIGESRSAAPATGEGNGEEAGDSQDAPQQAGPAVEFLGYRLIDTYPQFHYRVDGHLVREVVVVRPDGPGVLRTFEIQSEGKPVRFIPNVQSDVKFVASQGQWQPDGSLLLTPKQAKRFSITMVQPETDPFE